MATKLINQDNVTSGLRAVTQALNPFVQRHMTKKYGKNWLPAFVQRHPRTRGDEEHLGDLGYLIWVLTKEEQAFSAVLTPHGRNLAHRVREARNLNSHDQLNDLDPEIARTALRQMSEFLKLIGATGQAGEVQQLTRQVRPADGAKPHVVKAARPATPSRSKNKHNRTRASRRPVIKISFGAVVALLLIGGAVAWLAFRPTKADPYEGKYKNIKIGARLNAASLEVPEDYHLNFLDEPVTPVQGKSGGDLNLIAGRLSVRSGHLAVLTRREKLTYTTCQANTRFTTTAPATKGLRFCVTTPNGLVAAGTVNSIRRQGANTYTKLTLTIWKGRV
ncbi:MAG: Swt1 family HEPN domain-containing protein [Streptosporangiaceae bacterium]